MFQRLLSLIVSPKTTLVLLIAFAVASAKGTLVENDYGTEAARALVYNAWWFEAIMALLAVNFIGNIQRYGLWRKPKWSLLTFHLGFVIILLGAFITRYTGYEGMMDIREGQSVDFMYSEYNHLSIQSGTTSNSREIKPATKDAQYSVSIDLDGQPCVLETHTFIPGAVPTLVEGQDHYIHVIVAEGNSRPSYYIKEGSVVHTLHGTIGFNTVEPCFIHLTQDADGIFYVRSKAHVDFMRIEEQMAGNIPADSTSTLFHQAFYRSQDLTFTVMSNHPAAHLTYETAEDKKVRDALPGKLLANLHYNGTSTPVTLTYNKGYTHKASAVVNGHPVELTVGPKSIPLGFALALENFEIEHYPGSKSPSSYSSYLRVIDNDQETPFHLYMNNVLDYKGYRFFQASYTQDEQGTILSVNHDWWGTWITYLGYFLMTLGMLWALFAKHSRFSFLGKELNAIKAKKAALGLAVLLSPAQLLAQENTLSLEQQAGIYPSHAIESFEALLVQDMDGRIKPLGTLAAEMTRKLTGNTKFYLNYAGEEHTLRANQLFLALNARPEFWSQAPIIAVDLQKGSSVFEALGIAPAEHISAMQCYTQEGTYALEEVVAEAHNTKPANRSVQMKEVLKVDERFNILYHALTDSYLKLFPKAGDADNTWYSDKQMLFGFAAQDSIFIKHILPTYYASLDSAHITGNWDNPTKYTGYISKFQEHYAADILPPPSRIKAELLYNKLKLFLHLFYSYWVFGLVLLVVGVLKLFSKHPALAVVGKISFGIVVFFFLAHTFNIILRWYAGNYPPWSNGYEMIVLVSWFTMLFALLFVKRSNFILPLGALFAGTLLFVAFLDWLNPEITTLVPVLKSYWLKIHVAIIVGSYGPLALSALLGLTALWMGILDKKGRALVQLSIKELTVLNEMSMIIGLYMLAIGTFIGGIWANESWGRYWGWDPKETWALISILVYAVVTHLRLIPAIAKQPFWFNATSLIAFYAIIMTSFGVNYYLSGLHSYATGDPVPVPMWFYYSVGATLITVALGFVRRR